ncbi:MAG: hypothetical protein EPO21_02800 [Chloroflexota bacterium]|nr:MAG: hypothetical protein EPO21_02800 [Chloroflexota bacterium]
MSQLDVFHRNLAGGDSCLHCGLCMSYCAWDAYEATHPGQQGDPTICRDCMLCFRVCTRAHSNHAELEPELFGAARENALLGYYRSAWAAKVPLKSAGVQDAGVTTALLTFLLEQKQIDAALVTGRDAEWRPQPMIATTPAEVQAAAGSKYTAAAALSQLKPALEQFTRLAFVGTPCQVASLRNLQRRQDSRYPAERIVVVLGLFCAESFTYGERGVRGIAQWVESDLGIPLTSATRFDIKKNNLLVSDAERTEGRPLGEIRDLSWPICHSCQDFTAELADISIGAVGSKADENTLLVRSARGAELVEQAREQGILELGEVRSFAILEKIAQDKHARREELMPEEAQFLLKRTIRGNRKKAGGKD